MTNFTAPQPITALPPDFSTIEAFPSLSDATEALEALGAKPQHVRAIFRAFLGRGSWPEADDARFPKRLREALPAWRRRMDAVLTLRSRHPGGDPESERLLVTLADRQMVECVLLPRRGLCISTQMGCAVGCRFCMTGKGGLLRQLSDLEIVSQVRLGRVLRPETKKVVFMGMGEPSHNLKNVLSALLFLADYGEFGHKDLVLSTVGDERLFEALYASRVRPALAVSLHTVDEEKRRGLLPKGCRMTVGALLEAAERYARFSGYPVQYEWTLMEGVNDGMEEIGRLSDLIRGHYAMVNFIPVNVVEGSVYRRPSREHAVELVRRLRAAGIIATLRDSAAQDVEGGCGQLRARVLREAGEIG